MPSQSELMAYVVDYGISAILFLVLLFVTWIVAGWAQNITRKAGEKKNMDPALNGFLSKMVRTIILVVGVISCLGTLGVETASFAAVLAASGFAVGMALQGTLSHFASGVMILLFKPFTVGQYIKVAGAEGTVANIDLFTTELDTPDKRRVIVPNGSIFGSQIENVSHHDTRRVDVAVGTDYGADLDKTREILMNAANSLPQVMKDPAAVVVLTSLGASSVDWSVRVWVNASDYWPVMDALTRVVKYELDKADIGIPFPQMDVNFENAMFSGGASSSNTTSANTVQ